ncbi:MAG: aspartate kinase [Bacteroidales bacterium]|nr:aspartate kinase [Bacteroidales bacterium]
MQVFKFGGASVKNAEAVRNLQEIVKPYQNNLTIVVSAMHKNTNAFEKLHEFHRAENEKKWQQLDDIKSFHINICKNLFDNENFKTGDFLSEYFNEINEIIQQKPIENYDFSYDKLIPYGELLSTAIISKFLKQTNDNVEFLDIRKIIRTNNTYREARINWEETKKLSSEYFSKNKHKLVVTQGFIAQDNSFNNTTLGREGSDFSAAILAYVLNAEKIVIWKDVPGIMTADPALYPHAEKIDKLTYKEAIELAFYGAKVIHPRTVKPLENKNIPLWVNSFMNPKEDGTCISNFDDFIKYPPILILKHKQILLSISPKDFSFIAEDHISKIFALFNKHRTKVNLMQNSAISFSVCADTNSNSFNLLIEDLQEEFTVLYNKNLSLITIRHYNDEIIEKMTYEKEILLEQKSRNTVRFVIKS